jgi:chromosome segregation ATPase
VKEMRRQLTKLGDRIRKVEVDIQIAQEEIKITNDKIRKLSMLDSQVKLSAQNLDDLRRSQADMNSVLMSEIASLKLGLGPRLEQQLKDHAFEINTLTSRFQQLYHVVVNTLYPDYPKTSDPRNANQTSPKITSNPKTAAVF